MAPNKDSPSILSSLCFTVRFQSSWNALLWMAWCLFCLGTQFPSTIYLIFHSFPTNLQCQFCYIIFFFFFVILFVIFILVHIGALYSVVVVIPFFLFLGKCYTVDFCSYISTSCYLVGKVSLCGGILQECFGFYAFLNISRVTLSIFSHICTHKSGRVLNLHV